MQPKQAITGSVGYTGNSKMATPIIGTSIDNVAKARIGEAYPARVTISVTIDLHAFSGETRGEWEDLRESDVVFLLFINRPRANRGDFQLTQFLDDFGVRAIRGAEIVEIRDEANNLLKGNR
jgi:intron-binding protein aquarius